MPIPSPHPNESKEKFIPRCISTLSKLDPNKPQKQVVAICHSEWKRKKLSELHSKNEKNI